MTTASNPRDKWIPWYFVAFFVGLAVIDGILVTIAVRTHTGTVTEHAYEKGLNYNQVVEAERRQEKLGWNADIAYEKSGKLDGALVVSITDANGDKIIPESVSASFTRPTQAGMDFTMPLEVSADGSAKGKVIFPVHGLWEIRIYATKGDSQFQKSKRVVIE